MNCRVGSVVRSGRAVTIGQAVEPGVLATAVRKGRVEDGGRTVAVDAPSAPPVHEHIGCVRPGMGLRRETALARAARTLDLSTPYDEDIAAVRTKLADIDVDSADLASHRRRVAEAGGNRETLREEVAVARGRLEQARESGGDTESATAALEEAIRRLSEVETEAIAAREQLDAAQVEQRTRRDVQERRFRLEDRLANLEREARAHLADTVRDDFHDAIGAIPGDAGGDSGSADPVTSALAVARLADCPAPIVLACDRFETAEHATDVIDTPVLKVQMR